VPLLFWSKSRIIAHSKETFLNWELLLGIEDFILDISYSELKSEAEYALANK
jgi:uncharacterized membrane protein YhhN